MKISSPLDNAAEVKRLVEVGADEFYCGIVSEEWKERYTAIASANRREWVTNNFTSFDELENAVKIAHSFKKPVFLTLNAHFYTSEQYPLLLGEVKRAVSIGVDGFIIADIALILKLREAGVKSDIVISTGGVTLNSEAARFYSGLGATHITLPRHLASSEIKQIAEDNKDIKFHVFILNEGCFNLDGFCTFHHGIGSEKWEKRMLACSLPYDVKIMEKISPLKERTIRYRLNNLTKNLLINCGACALYDFDRAGVYAVKIVGRGNPTEKKVKDIRFFRELLDCLEDSRDKESFALKAKSLYERVYHTKCTYRNCYYPEF